MTDSSPAISRTKPTKVTTAPASPACERSWLYSVPISKLASEIVVSIFELSISAFLHWLWCGASSCLGALDLIVERKVYCYGNARFI